MATRNSTQSQLERLRVKKEQLDAKLKVDEYRRKERELRAKLKTMGGRVR